MKWTLEISWKIETVERHCCYQEVGTFLICLHSETTREWSGYTGALHQDCYYQMMLVQSLMYFLCDKLDQNYPAGCLSTSAPQDTQFYCFLLALFLCPLPEGDQWCFHYRWSSTRSGLTLKPLFSLFPETVFPLVIFSVLFLSKSSCINPLVQPDTAWRKVVIMISQINRRGS